MRAKPMRDVIRVVCFFLCFLPLVVSAQWTPVGPDGGDVRTLAYDPKNPDRLILGTSAGQLYVSNDAGRSWSRFARLGGGNDYVLDNIEIDPTDSRTMYVAAWSVEDQLKSGDLFRTRDGGKTWTALPAMHGKSIRALATSVSDRRIVVVGALDGVFRSRDGGDSWERISPANHAEIKNIESIAIDPRDPNVIYAGTWHLAWKTSDGGVSWRPIKNGVVDDSDVFSIIVDRQNSSVVYLSACSGIYKSESAAELFKKIQGIPFSARRTRVLQQDPNDTNVVYAGTTEGLWKTTDAGKTWKRVTAPNIIVNDVLVDPRQSTHVLLATDRSGVLASRDGAQTFTASNRGFSHRQVSAVVVDRNDPDTLYAGVVNDKEFGGIFVSSNGGSDWKQLTDGLAGKDVFTLAQAENGALVAGTNRGVFMLPRGERVWRPINTIVTEKQVKVAPAKKSKKSKAQPTYKTQVVKSELTARVSQISIEKGMWFAATSNGLYSSEDSGRSWRAVDIAGHRSFLGVQVLDDAVVAATLNAVAVSRDKGATWKVSSMPKWVHAIFSVAITPDGIWAASREGALRSADWGGSWEHVLGGLPGRNVAAVTYDAQLARLRATSFSGELFESRDAGQTWKRVQAGWVVRNVASGGGKVLAITAFDGLLMMREPEPGAVVGGGGGSTR
ncbi:MAG TPA: transcriptional regulator [Terriglobales bacterium]|nr:transcriptional regulator [Terriglobales bacterium]